MFAGQVITWVPPLIFTGMNEAGVSQNIGIMVLDVFFLVSGVAYVMMGSFRKAVQVASRNKPSAAISPLTVEEANW